MKILKSIALVITGLIIIVLISGLIIPKEVVIERPVTINDSVNHVFAQVCYLKNMREWSPWKDYDPNMEFNYAGQDGEVGAQYHWQGNKDVGKGYQEIVAIDPGKRIDLKLVFEEPFESESEVYFLFNDMGNQTNIVWGYKEHTPIPKNVLMKIIGMEKMLTKDFDRGLQSLKSVCEEGQL